MNKSIEAVLASRGRGDALQPWRIRRRKTTHPLQDPIVIERVPPGKVRRQFSAPAEGLAKARIKAVAARLPSARERAASHTHSFDEVEHGKPVRLVAYHGTHPHAWETIEANGFQLGDHRSHGLGPAQANKMVARMGSNNEWDRNHLLGDGIYFADSKREASKYGHARPVEIQLKKPYVMSRGSIADFRNLNIDELKKQGHDGVVVQSGRYGIYGGENYRQGVAFSPTAVRVLDKVPRPTVLAQGALVRHRETGEVGEVRTVRPTLPHHNEWRKEAGKEPMDAYLSVRWRGLKGQSKARTEHNVSNRHVHMHLDKALQKSWQVKPFTPMMQMGKRSAVQHARISKPGHPGAIISFRHNPKTGHTEVLQFRAYRIHDQAYADHQAALDRGERPDENMLVFHRSNVGVIGPSGVRAAARYLRETIGSKSVGGVRVSGSRVMNRNTLPKAPVRRVGDLESMPGVAVKRGLAKGPVDLLYRLSVTKTDPDDRVTLRRDPRRGATYFASTLAGAYAGAQTSAKFENVPGAVKMVQPIRRGSLRIYGHRLPMVVKESDVERGLQHIERLAARAPHPAIGQMASALGAHLWDRPHTKVTLKGGAPGRHYHAPHHALSWGDFEAHHHIPGMKSPFVEYERDGRTVIDAARDSHPDHAPHQSLTQMAIHHLGYHGAAVSDEAGNWGTKNHGPAWTYATQGEVPSPRKLGSIALLPRATEKIRPRALKEQNLARVHQKINQRAVALGRGR
jgi:hypothetical protein